MDTKTVLAELKVRLSESKAFGLMSEFTQTAILYPSAHIVLAKPNPKRDKVIADLSDKLYPFHSPFRKPLSEYGNSVILICHDQTVPFMLAEVAEFIIYLERFYLEIKAANAVQEMQLYYKQFTLKAKQLVDAMLDDLDMYASRYNFPADRGAWMAIYKEAKAKQIQGLGN